MALRDIWAEDPDSPRVIIHPPVIYGAGFIIGYALDFWWGWSFGVGEATGLGWLLVIGGLALALWGIWHFRRAGTSVPTHRPATALVVEGPYRVTRNPVYMALNAIYLGLCALLDAPAALLMLLGILPLMHYGVVLREERYLEAKFGEDYRQFKQATKRYL